MAIAFDASSSGVWKSGSTASWSHTCSGSDRVLIVGLSYGSTTSISSVTYNGAALSLLRSFTSGFGDKVDVYYLVAPSTGTNTVNVTLNGSTVIVSSSVSYTGVKQTGLPDAQTEGSMGSSQSFAATVTSVASNCWIVAWTECGNGGLGAGASTTMRVRNATATGNGFLDSNAPRTSGSNTLNGTYGSGSNNTAYWTIFSLAPNSTTYNQSLTLTATGTPSLARIFKAFRSVVATGSASVTLSRLAQLTKTLSATATATGSLVRASISALSAEATAVLSLSKAHIRGHILQATATAQVVLLRGVAYMKALAATATASLSISKLAAKTLLVTATGTTALLFGRFFARSLAVLATATASLAKQGLFKRLLTATGSVAVVSLKGMKDGLNFIYSKLHAPTGSTSYSETHPRVGTDRYEQTHPPR